MKVTSDYHNFGKEIHTMKKIYKYARKSESSTPEVVEYGMIMHASDDSNGTQQLMSYLIMPRYG